MEVLGQASEVRAWQKSIGCAVASRRQIQSKRKGKPIVSCGGENRFAYSWVLDLPTADTAEYFDISNHPQARAV
jgi:hypothetical protein